MNSRLGMAAIIVAALVLLNGGSVRAGEVIIVPQGAGAMPPDPGQINRDAAIDNGLKARQYGDPDHPGPALIIAPAASPDSTAERNREALLRNRLRAHNQSQSGTGTTLVIAPGAGVSSQNALDTAMDRANAFSDGDAANRRPCTNATSSVGTVGNTVAVDRSGDPTSAAQGVTTVAVGGCR